MTRIWEIVTHQGRARAARVGLGPGSRNHGEVQTWEISPDISQVDLSAQYARQWAATRGQPRERAMRPVESGSGKCES